MRLLIASLWLWGGIAGSAAAAQAPMVSFEIVGAPRQFTLASGLQEISGLALASDNSVYAHNDEHGIVYEVSLIDGAVKKAFALGKPTVSADFEGIAAEKDRIYLITSSGLLYEAIIGEHAKRVRFNVYDTGAGAFCEVEGLARSGRVGEFFILCKAAKVDALKRRLVVYRWSLEERAPVIEPWVNIAYADFLVTQNSERFRPSALDWDPAGEVLVIISANSQQLVVVNRDGELFHEKLWPREEHVQIEGVLLLPSGDLVVAEEGQRHNPGKISVYQLNRSEN